MVKKDHYTFRISAKSNELTSFVSNMRRISLFKKSCDKAEEYHYIVPSECDLHPV